MKKHKLINASAPADRKPTALTLLGLLTAVGLGLAPSGLNAAGPPYQLQVVAYLCHRRTGGNRR